jgi:hypothetical protein
MRPLRNWLALAVPAALAALVVGAAPAASAAAAATASLGPGSRPVRTAVEVCGTGAALVRPGSMVLTCADHGMIAEHLHWSSWTWSRAAATGTVTWRTGTAAAAASIRWHNTSARVTLTGPVSEPGKGILFTRLDLHVTGRTPPGFMRDVAFSEAPMPKAPASPQASTPAAALPLRSSSAASGTLSYALIEGFWIRAGGPSGSAGSYTYPQVAAAITECESSYQPGIIQPGQPYSTTGWGLWQITPGNSVPQYGTDFQILDPWNNAEEAVSKYEAAGGFSPWTTYVDGCYASYLQKAGADTAVTDPGEYVQINSAPPGTPSAPPAEPGSTYGPPVESIAATPAPAAGNGLNAFAMGSNGHLYHSYQVSNGQFSGWSAVAGSFPGGTVQGSIAALPAPAADNGLNVFGLGSNGHLYHSYQTSNGQFSGWSAIAGTLPT